MNCGDGRWTGGRAGERRAGSPSTSLVPRSGGISGYIAQIGDDRFTNFYTVTWKSRLLFLMAQRAGFADNMVNAAALARLYEQEPKNS